MIIENIKINKFDWIEGEKHIKLKTNLKFFLKVLSLSIFQDGSALHGSWRAPVRAVLAPLLCGGAVDGDQQARAARAAPAVYSGFDILLYILVSIYFLFPVCSCGQHGLPALRLPELCTGCCVVSTLGSEQRRGGGGSIVRAAGLGFAVHYVLH